MAVVKIGTNYRIMYESRNLTSGLDDIFATVRRPDGVKVGPVELEEEVIAELAGNYSKDLAIPMNAPLGEWVGTIVSMNEGIKSSFRFSVSDENGSTVSQSSDDDVEIVVDDEEISIVVDEIDPVSLAVEASDVIISLIENESIELAAEVDEVKLEIEEQTVEITVECEEL